MSQAGALGRSWRGHRFVWLGVIGAVVLIVIVFATFAISDSGIGKREYTADFSQAGGIRPGDKVRVAGIDVGEVSKTELARDHVKVTMEVDKKVEVRDDGSAEIKLSTLLGQRYVDIKIGDSTEPLEGSRIPLTQVPYDLQETIERGTPVLAGVNAEELSDSVSALNSQLKDAPGVTRTTLDALTEMSKVISNRSDQINLLIKDTETVTDVLNSSQYQLSVIVGQGQLLAQKIATRQQLVVQMLDGVANLAQQMEAMGAENNNQFAPLIGNLNTVSEGLEKNRDNLRHMLEVLPLTVRAIANTTGSGPYAMGYLPWGIFPDNWLCAARVVNGC
ncbi:virulence factor Mce-like protein [Williamsia limnetica]|uniref:Virulence factor Mce-like protein n=1 Tax=Williamsia limnetica TaxID=882452 RepID=A0A318RZ77_WILLI|nr:MlaD family protein [Williamsia limnetica]PYE15828.1 virulence factor Mce-like protein [Williamsia limnetica]